MIKLFSLIH